jgi:hypothetical protein
MGVFLSVVSLLPNSPLPPDPHTQTEPSDLIATAANRWTVDADSL